MNQKISGTFANGQEWIGVRVPVDARDFKTETEDYNQLSYWNGENLEPTVKTIPNGYAILGCITKGVVEFEAKEWMIEENGDGCYLDYVNQKPDNKYTLLSAQESLQSYFTAKLKKVYPLPENPYGEKEPSVFMLKLRKGSRYMRPTDEYVKDWQAAQLKVCPQKILVIFKNK